MRRYPIAAPHWLIALAACLLAGQAGANVGTPTPGERFN